MMFIGLDTTEQSSIDAARAMVESRLEVSGLNLLINNAAILQRSPLDVVTAEMMVEHYRVNCAAPLMVTKVNRPLDR